MLWQQASMNNTPVLRCGIYKEHSQETYFRSRHCFADSHELKQVTVWQCVLEGFYGFLSQDQFSWDQLPPDQLSRDQLVKRSICHEINSIFNVKKMVFWTLSKCFWNIFFWNSNKQHANIPVPQTSEKVKGFWDVSLTRLGAKEELCTSVGEAIDVTCTQHNHPPDQASNKAKKLVSLITGTMQPY